MKSTTLFICIVTALLIALSAHKSNAQINSFWVGLDTTGAMSYEDIMAQTFGNLNPAHYPSGILLNRVPGISKTREMDGTLGTPVINTDEWLSIYDAVYWSFVNRPTGFLHITDFYEQIMNVKVENFAFDNASVIPLGIIHFDYHDLKSNAVTDNLIGFNQQLKGFVNTSSISPFDEKTVFAASPMDIAITGPVVHYVLDAIFLKTNVVANISAIEIDFGDGAGLQQVSFGNVYTINYSATGQFLINTKITYATGDEFNCTSAISIASPTGGGATKGGTECQKCVEDPPGFPSTQAAPDFVSLPFIANKLLTDPFAIHPISIGQYGVYYGCENINDKKIRKPVILVTGFSPQLDLCMDPTFGFYYCNFNDAGLLDDLRAKNFDIIIVRFTNGVDFIQNNAESLIKIIKNINFQKSGNVENVIIGYSQGDLIAKYALTKMEFEFMHIGGQFHPPHHSKLHVSYEGEHQGANTVLGMQHSLEGLITVTSPAAILVGVLNLLYLSRQTYNSPAAKQLSIYHHTKTGNNNSPAQGPHQYRTNFLGNLAAFEHSATNVDKIGYPAFSRNIGISSGSAIATPIGISDGTTLFQNTVSFLIPLPAPNTMKINTQYAYYSLTGNGEASVYDRFYSVTTGINVFGGSFSFTTAGIPIRKKTLDPGSYDNAPAGWDGQIINANKAHLAVGLANCVLSLNPSCKSFEKIPYDHKTCKDPATGCYQECFTPVVNILDIKNNGTSLKYDLAANGLFFDAGTPSAPLNTKSWGYPHLGESLGLFGSLTHYEVTPFDAVAATEINRRHVKFEPPEFHDFLMGEIAPDDLKLQNRSIGKHQLGYLADFEATRIVSGKNVTISTNEEDFVIEDQSIVKFRAGKEIVLKPGFSSLNGSDFHAYIDLGLYSGSGCTPSPACRLSSSDKDKSGGRNAELSEPLEEKDDEQILDEIKEPFSASIFPNPNSGQFTVNCVFQDMKSATLTIINLMGEYIYENQLNQTTSTIDISPHPKGVYFVKIVSGDEIIVKKVVYQ